jgi:threonine dehydrogenase-like Zn-dependent dehydrogenase
MRAVCVEAPRTLAVQEVEPPRAADGEALVRVGGCGVCGSDLNAWHGVPGVEYPLPAGAPGHEVWGTIEALGEGTTHLHAGQLVTGLMWNGLAELATARMDHLVAVERPLLGEPLACAVNVVRRAGLARGARVAIVGFGYLAALIARVLPPLTEWVAIARRPDSRDLALRLGGSAAYDFDGVPRTLWDSFPVVIEAAGVQQTLDYATWLTAYGGRLVIAGYHADGPRTVNMQSWNWKGLEVSNAHERRPEVYVSALRDGLRVLAERGIDLSDLVTHSVPLERAAQAFELAEQRPPGFVKAVVTP